jgi:soluble lytic murein transglycosylase-like protein
MLKKRQHPPAPLFLALTISIFLTVPVTALTKITDNDLQAVYNIGERFGIPLSIVRQLIKEESQGYVDAVSHKTAEGYYSRGLFQLYDKPGNIEWLLEKFYPSDPERFSFNDPIMNAFVAMPYLSYLHKRFGNWYQALVYYNHGDVKHYPDSTRAYAIRIVNAH